jgi:anaerobic magnesium-protoporphyrin IX monomethyl ester cyclase
MAGGPAHSGLDMPTMNENRTLVLVRLKNPTLGIITPPLGIGYLMKSLKPVENLVVRFIDCHLLDMEESTLIRCLRNIRPFLVGFLVFSADYVRFTNILPLLKKNLVNSTVVAGGPHVTALPEQTLQANPELDYIVCGEGERALPLLVQRLLDRGQTDSLADIPNLVYRENGRFIRNRTEWIEVNEVGAPDWELLKPHLYPPIQHGTFHRSTKVVPIMTSRGCPFPCTFCAGSLMTGKRIRRRDVGDVVDEIEFLQGRYGFEEFIVEDENFTYHKDHVLAFAAEIERRGIRCHFSFPNGIRLDRVDEEIAQKMQSMGGYMVAVGIESISADTLQRMGKRWNRQQIIDQVNLLKRHHFIVQANFILGFSGDTMQDIQESIDFAMELNIDQVYFGNYIPLPGTADFDRLMERGEIRLDGIDWNQYSAFYGQYPYHPPGVSVKELARAIQRATIRFYLRPRILSAFIRRLTRPVFFKSLLFRIFRVFARKRASS